MTTTTTRANGALPALSGALNRTTDPPAIQPHQEKIEPAGAAGDSANGLGVNRRSVMNMLVSAAAVTATATAVQETRPATAEERAAVTWGSSKIKFDWTNEGWANNYLPYVRIGIATLEKDHRALLVAVKELADEGAMPSMMDGMCQTKQHLEGLVEGLDIAISRSFLMLERLGYTPDNPPPDGAEHDEAALVPATFEPVEIDEKRVLTKYQNDRVYVALMLGVLQHSPVKLLEVVRNMMPKCDPADLGVTFAEAAKDFRALAEMFDTASARLEVSLNQLEAA